MKTDRSIQQRFQNSRNMIRPVKCHICRRQMYYGSDPKHVPEYLVKIQGDDNPAKHFYCHQLCWDRLFGGKKLDEILGL